MLEINGLLKFAEEDIFSEGCQFDTATQSKLKRKERD